jgi:hypothetical protein
MNRYGIIHKAILEFLSGRGEVYEKRDLEEILNSQFEYKLNKKYCINTVYHLAKDIIYEISDKYQGNLDNKQTAERVSKSLIILFGDENEPIS